MADKVDTSNIPEAGPNMSSYRAKRINSLHKSINDTVQEQNKKRLQVSSEISALTREQQKLMRDIDMERSEFTNETASAYNSVVKSLGLTVKNLSTGVKDITMDTAKATTSAISQYGKAIGEDININKQNTMAMALSKATPLFGYFAAKFMETDVFKNAAGKIKDTVGGAAKGVGRSLIDVFKRKDGERIESETPHLQKGGFVKKGGVVEVHAGEVVTPIEKLMRAIENDRKNIAETFFEEYMKAKMGDEESPWQDKLLKAILEMKAATIGTANRLQIAWQKTLLQHPTFRTMLMVGQTMKTVFETPLKFLFGIRGGFAGDVRRATASSNVYMKQINLLALIYTKGMTFLRNIEKYTKVSAEALVGEEVKPTADKTYTLFGKIRSYMTSREFQKDSLFKKLTGNLDLDTDAMEEAGITGFKSFLHPIKFLKSLGITKENVVGKFTEKPSKKGKKTPEENISAMNGSIIDIKEKIFKNFKKSDSREDKKISLLDRIRKRTKEGSSIFSSIGSKFSKMGNSIKGWIPIILGVLSKIGGAIFKIVKPILSIAGFILKPFGKAGMKIGSKLLGVGRAGLGAAKAGGIRGLLGWGAKGALGAAGAAATIGGGLAIGGGMGIWDAIQALRDPEGFAGGILARGLAGFLGGTDSGAKGALRGVAKGAALGAAIGTIIPGAGTLIGGALGAAAGGILGFIGGKNISVGLQNVGWGIKSMLGAVWTLIKLPAKILMWGISSAFDAVKGVFKDFKEIFSKDKTILERVMSVGKFLMDVMTFPMTVLMGVAKKVGAAIDGWLSSYPVIGKIYTKVRDKMTGGSKDVGQSFMNAITGIESPVVTHTDSDHKFAKEIADAYAKDEVTKQTMVANEVRKSSDTMRKEMEKSTNATTRATISSAHTIVSNNQNTVNNNSSGNQFRGIPTSSGSRIAERVAAANIN